MHMCMLIFPLCDDDPQCVPRLMKPEQFRQIERSVGWPNGAAGSHPPWLPHVGGNEIETIKKQVQIYHAMHLVGGLEHLCFRILGNNSPN